MKIKTESGSHYEVELYPVGGRCRRLSGPNDPTPRQGKDGEWKGFTFLMAPIAVGSPMIFVWDSTTPLLNPNEPGVPTTMTSAVVEITP